MMWTARRRRRGSPAEDPALPGRHRARPKGARARNVGASVRRGGVAVGWHGGCSWRVQRRTAGHVPSASSLVPVVNRMNDNHPHTLSTPNVQLPMRRRSFVRGLLSATAAALAGITNACGDADGSTTVELEPLVLRKSASALSADEIDRFRRAFEFAVAQGYFDPFNDEHYDHHKHRHHGQDVLATSPMTIMTSHHASAGFRLLPWHRAFILEAERMLRAALRARNRAEGRNPAEADLLFIPYWDAAHDQALPDWVLELQPQGGTAIVPPDLPEGHAGYGKPIGERYAIEFRRWPGQNPVFDVLHKPDQVERILGQTTFAAFYQALDVAPEVVSARLPAALAALQALGDLLPEEESIQILLAATENPPTTTEQQTEVTNALLALGYIAAVETRKPQPDREIVAAVEAVYGAFRFMPHLLMHLWAGGLDPANADIRGTVTYFQELAVDPVFWMLHTELDRYWYTWETSHDEKPALTGEDAVFQPISEASGAWYGGGKEYGLDELTAHAELPYAYDALFMTGSEGASVHTHAASG
jgi:hypothetical protein